MFLLWLRQLSRCGDQTPALVPPRVEGRSSPTNTPVFPTSSFILPSFGWLCILFSSAQVLLSALSWYSACTSVSEGVFLMYPWRKMSPGPPTLLPPCYTPKIIFNFPFDFFYCSLVIQKCVVQLPHICRLYSFPLIDS